MEIWQILNFYSRKVLHENTISQTLYDLKGMEVHFMIWKVGKTGGGRECLLEFR